MVIGGNQPYFIPYIGYWQLINAVDVFVIADDYNYIERGWINRNKILENGKATFFNIEIDHASSNKPINGLQLSDRFNPAEKIARLRFAYKKAPNFQEGIALMEQVLSFEDKNLAAFLEHSIRCISDYLGVQTQFIRSSDVPNNCALKREYRIYDFCKYVGANTCINAIGGKELYTFEQFREQGIKLGFIHCGNICYKQFSNEFLPSLSIIDVIMFNSKEQICQMLNQYTIEWEET